MPTTIQVGNVELAALSDGGFERPPQQFMPDVPVQAWEPYRAQHLDADGNIRLNLGCFLVRSGGRTVLVDTGIGGRGGGFPPGRLMDELKAVGVAPEQIEQVVITHMHFDHIGWNTVDRNGRPEVTFPRARYVIQRREWEYWSGEESAKQTMETLCYPVERAGQLDLVDAEHRPTAELTMLSTPGHTPGHVSILIRSGGEGAVILGDVAHNPVQVTEPDWSIVADVDKDLGRQSRHALWERIAAEGLRVAAGHFRPDSFGRFVRLEGKQMWQGL